MKRELAFALEAQSQLTESLGRTRSSKSQLSNRSNEKIQDPNESEVQLNGLIDQNRARIHTCNALHAYRRNKRLKTGRTEGESVIIEESKGEFVRPISEGEVKEVNGDFPVECVAPRRFTRSALKSKVRNLGLGNGSFGNYVASEGAKDGVSLETGENVSGRGNSHKKMGLKKKKKIELENRPTTVEELLETGLLEGYPVSYKSGKKGNVLRGTIKDAGILCYCSLCKGSRVVTPSVFEVHARNLYRHEYIRLENGRSLFQLVKACTSTSLETLEETIQSFIGPLPAKESGICQNCKVSGLPTCALNEGRICDSCVDSVKSQASLTNTNSNSITSQASPKNTTGLKSSKTSTIKTSEKARSSKTVPVMKSSASAKLLTWSRKKGRGKMKRKALDPPLAPTSPGSDSVYLREKSQRKIKKTSSTLGEFSKSPKRSSSRILSQKKSEGKTSKKLSKSSPVSTRKSESNSRWKITKKDLRMHRLVFQENGLPEGTEVAYYSHGQKLLEGYKKGSGIFCHCCNTEVSASQFEAHAGWASRRKPYGYIYTSNGVSLHELAISLLKGRTSSLKDNDDLCIICADGGNLLLCDGCPRAFHKECASLSMIPRGKWYCTYCQNMFQREKFVEHNANALAAGRVSGGVDPIEQIATRCIRIVKNPDEAIVIACVLCRGYDYSNSGFGPRTVILCDQCEKEYHVGCLKERDMADLKELPKEKWFCYTDCRRIYTALQNLINSGAEKLSESLLDVIRKKEIVSGSKDVNELDVRWRLLSGKIASRETRLLLSQAVAIFHECFDPIVDPVTGCDFIPTMVYGRNIRGQDFGGMYCAILTVKSVVVSAGILRVFGPDRAELPLVATSKANQGKGYFQLLFSCIEKLLAFLKVKNLVLPAAEVAESIWTDRFHFEKISPQQLIEYRKDFWQMLSFKGTSMLEKQVPSCRITRRDATSSS